MSSDPRNPMDVTSVNTESLYQIYHDEYLSKGNLLLKFNLAWNPLTNGINPNKEFNAYNEDKKFYCGFEPHALDADEFIRIVAEEEMPKGYFWAFMEKGKNEVTVITNPRLPFQPW